MLDIMTLYRVFVCYYRNILNSAIAGIRASSRLFTCFKKL